MKMGSIRALESELWLKKLRAEYWEEFGVVPPWLDTEQPDM